MRCRPTPSLLAFALVGTMGCAATPPRAARARTAPSAGDVRVLVLEARWLTEGEHVDLDVSPIRESLAPHVQIVAATDAALEPTCAEDVACVRDVGARARATHVVAVELASLGGTVVVRVRLIATGHGDADVARQRVLGSATRERVETALTEMTEDLVAPLLPAPVEERAWYERGYVYVIGVGVVAGAVGTGVAVHRRREGIPDVVVTPP